MKLFPAWGSSACCWNKVHGFEILLKGMQIKCCCCGSIFSLVWILFSFVFRYGNIDNEFETKENKIWTKGKIKPQHSDGVIVLLLNCGLFMRWIGFYIKIMMKKKKRGHFFSNFYISLIAKHVRCECQYN